MKKYKSYIQIAVGVLVSVLSVYFIFRSVDFEAVLESIKSLNIALVIIHTIISGSILSLRAIRWSYFIPIDKEIRKPSIIAATYIGYMSNNVLPAKLGEVVRTYVLAEKEDIKKSTIFASVVSERLIDLITSVVMLSLVVLFIRNIASQVYYAIIIVSTIAIVGVSFLVFLSVKQELAMKFVGFFLKFLPQVVAQKIEAFLNSFVHGIGIKRGKYSILMIIFYTVAYWTLQIFASWILLRAYGLFGLSFVDTMFVVVITGFGFAIPSAPTGIGPIEAATIFALTTLAVNYDIAVSYAIVSHVISIIIITILGFVAMLTTGSSLRKAIASSSKSDDTINNLTEK